MKTQGAKSRIYPPVFEFFLTAAQKPFNGAGNREVIPQSWRLGQGSDRRLINLAQGRGLTTIYVLVATTIRRWLSHV